MPTPRTARSPRRCISRAADGTKWLTAAPPRRAASRRLADRCVFVAVGFVPLGRMDAQVVDVGERAHARHPFGHLSNAFDLLLQKRFSHRLGSCPPEGPTHGSQSAGFYGTLR